jgi:hypothetical protein
VEHEKPAQTTTIRIDSQLAAMIAAIAFHRDVTASEIVSPMIRRKIENEFDSLPEFLKAKFAPSVAAK